ncbi:MAG TPA: hypothetical protein VGR43_06960 [Dehalococcoidia bacterium]|jgi:methionine-rich copper-binding protein CopC|nr:hypothetical protein [Dehalococcoidia bacterium]
MKLAAAVLVAAGTVILTLSIASAEEPEVIYQFPLDGAILEDAPLSIQLCFRDPIDTRDLLKGGDFEFAVVDPSGLQLGHRAIFQPDGYGVVVQPGISSSPPGGWRFDWQVRDEASEDPAEGTIRFTVKEGGVAVLPAEPPPCTASGTPGPASPAATDAVDGNTEPEEGDGPDVLLLALLTTGAAGAAGVVAMIGYLVRRRIGFWPHRPPDRDGGDAPHH